MSIKIALVFIIIYFLILYLIAYFANRGYREEDDILFVSRTQWHAILTLWLPSLIILVKR
jgi:hypothetical protein